MQLVYNTIRLQARRNIQHQQLTLIRTVAADDGAPDPRTRSYRPVRVERGIQ